MIATLALVVLIIALLSLLMVIENTVDEMIETPWDDLTPEQREILRELQEMSDR